VSRVPGSARSRLPRSGNKGNGSFEAHEDSVCSVSKGTTECRRMPLNDQSANRNGKKKQSLPQTLQPSFTTSFFLLTNPGAVFFLNQFVDSFTGLHNEARGKDGKGLKTGEVLDTITGMTSCMQPCESGSEYIPVGFQLV